MQTTSLLSFSQHLITSLCLVIGLSIQGTLVAQQTKTKAKKDYKYYVKEGNKILFSDKENKASILILQEGIQYAIKHYGKNSDEHMEMIHYLAEAYSVKQRAKAKKYYQIILKTGKIQKLYYGLALVGLYSLYLKHHQYRKAVHLVQKNLSIIEQKQGKNTLDYLGGLEDLASCYSQMFNYPKTLETHLQILQIKEKKYGKANIKYCRTLQQVAFFYGKTGNYAKGEACYQELLNITADKPRLYRLARIPTLKSMALFYIRMGQYIKAEDAYQRAIKLGEQVWPKGNRQYTRLVHRLTRLYQHMRQYPKVKQLLTASVEKALQKWGKNHEYYIYAVDNLAEFYYKIGQYTKAKKLFQESRQYFLKKSGKANIFYLSNTFRIGQICWYTNRHQEANDYYKEYQQIKKQVYGSKSIVYGHALRKIALSYHMPGYYAKAETLHLKSLKIIRKSLGRHHKEYLKGLNLLAGMYTRQGKYPQAEAIYQRVLTIKEKALGKNNLQFVRAMDNLAHLYQTMGKYDKAQELYLAGAQVVQQIFGKDNFHYAKTLNNLGELYHHKGEYIKAEKLYQENGQIILKTLGKDVPEYITFLNNQAALYQDMGQYAQAEAIYEQMRQRPYFRPTISYLTNLARVYDQSGQYQKEKRLLQRKIRFIVRNRGKKHLSYVKALGEMAWYLFKRDTAYHKAEALYQESLQITQKTIGKESFNYGEILHKPGQLYQAQGQYAKAEAMFLESLQLKEKKLGEQHPSRLYVLNSLAGLHVAQKKYAQAISFYLEAMRLKIDEIKHNKFIFSEKGQKAYLKRNEFFFNDFKNFFVAYFASVKATKKEKGALAQELFNVQLATKGQLLNGKQQLLHLLQQQSKPDSSLQARFHDYVSLKAQIARHVNIPLNQQRAAGFDLKQKRQAVEVLEKQLYKSLGKTIRGTKKEPTLPVIRQALKAKEAAIEIIEHHVAPIPGAQTKTLYLVLIITPRQAYPEVRILDGTSFARQARHYHKAILTQKTDTTSYRSFWQPIGDYLQTQGIQRVYIAPDGVYNQLNLNTLQNTVTGKYLEDEINVEIVTTLQEIAKTKAKFKASDQVVLFGRPLYTLPMADLQKKEKAFKKISQQGFSDFHFPPTPAPLLVQSKQRSGWNDLPGTEAEIKTIAQLLQQKQSLKVSTHLGNEALEIAVKQVKRPKILHIATHGFFVENLKAPTKVHKENVVFDNFSRSGVLNRSNYAIKVAREEPMLRSGIILAGASSYAKAIAKPSEVEDGILTAYEASQMDLQGTELVVLSACETGLGESTHGEGVYGLQRSFIAAGAQSVLISLWKIDDEATQILMSKFYEEWITHNKSKRAALKAAQLYLRKYEKNGQKIYATPYYWGAFQIIGR